MERLHLLAMGLLVMITSPAELEDTAEPLAPEPLAPEPLPADPPPAEPPFSPSFFMNPREPRPLEGKGSNTTAFTTRQHVSN